MEYECRSLLPTSLEEEKISDKYTYSSPELNLALAMLQQDMNVRPDSTTDPSLLLQQILSKPDTSKELARLQSKLLNDHVVVKPEPLWSANTGISTMKPMSLFNSPSPNISYIEPLHIAGKGRVHGKRGRPLGSVGRRKLLEQSQERLRNELRAELAKTMTPERQTHMEKIKKMISDNEVRLRALNETKSSGPRPGEKRDVSSQQSPTSTVPIAPKPSEAYLVQSPCKQQKLEMSKIEPIYNMLASYSTPSYTESPTMLPKSFLSPLTPPTPPTTRFTTPSPPSQPSTSQPSSTTADSNQKVMVEQLLSPLSPITNQWPLTSLDPMSIAGLEAAAGLIMRMRGDKVEAKKCMSCCVEMSPLSTTMICEMCTLLRTLFLRQNMMASQQQRAAEELLDRLKNKNNLS